MRRPLPTRRPCVTTDTHWQGNAITVTVGYYLDGAPAEVFADHAKGGPISGTVSDACVGMSMAMQHGIGPDLLGKSLGTVPYWQIGTEGMEMVDAPASPIGTIIAEIRKAATHNISPQTLASPQAVAVSSPQGETS